jgi:hypothetical protein
VIRTGSCADEQTSRRVEHVRSALHHNCSSTVTDGRQPIIASAVCFSMSAATVMESPTGTMAFAVAYADELELVDRGGLAADGSWSDQLAHLGRA